MKSIARLLSLAVLTFLPGCIYAESFIVLGADGNGDITGTPGQIVGYDFTFVNDTQYYALLDDSQIDFAPSFATYADYIAIESPEVSPNNNLVEPFSYVPTNGNDTSVETGLGQFAIDSQATVGETASGHVTLTFDLWSSDPNVDPNAVEVETGDVLTVPISISVVAPVSQTPTSSTPEPAPAAFFALGLTAVVFGVRRKRRQ